MDTPKIILVGITLALLAISLLFFFFFPSFILLKLFRLFRFLFDFAFVFVSFRFVFVFYFIYFILRTLTPKKIINATIWILGLEHKTLHNISIEGKNKNGQFLSNFHQESLNKLLQLHTPENTQPNPTPSRPTQSYPNDPHPTPQVQSISHLIMANKAKL